MATTCFICSLGKHRASEPLKRVRLTILLFCVSDRSLFDRGTETGFDYHIRIDHNLWSYLWILAHLRFKPRTELTGVEEYLLRKVLESDLSYFPTHRAMVLEESPGESSIEHDIAGESKQTVSSGRRAVGGLRSSRGRREGEELIDPASVAEQVSRAVLADTIPELERASKDRDSKVDGLTNRVAELSEQLEGIRHLLQAAAAEREAAAAALAAAGPTPAGPRVFRAASTS